MLTGLNEFLGIVPQTASVGHQQGEDDASEDGPAEEPTQGIRAEDKANQQRQDDGEESGG